MILIGCASNRAQQAAAARIGTAQAGVNLGQQPGECNVRVPAPALREGQEARTAIARYDAQLDVANNRLQNCYQFNEAVRAGLVRN